VILIKNNVSTDKYSIAVYFIKIYQTIRVIIASKNLTKKYFKIFLEKLIFLISTEKNIIIKIVDRVIIKVVKLVQFLVQ